MSRTRLILTGDGSWRVLLTSALWIPKLPSLCFPRKASNNERFLYMLYIFYCYTNSCPWKPVQDSNVVLAEMENLHSVSKDLRIWPMV